MDQQHQQQQQQQQVAAISKDPLSAMQSPPILQVPQHQQELIQIQSSSSSNSNSSSAATGGPSPMLTTQSNTNTTTNVSSSGSSSVISGHQHQRQQQPQNQQKISFHLKTSIFTRRVTIDSDKMALGLIKQLAIAFLNEIYFDHIYPTDTYIGDYIRKHGLTNNSDNLNMLYDRLVLRKYLPEQDQFVQFNSVSDIDQESYICIEISERQPTHQYHHHQTNASPHLLTSLSPLLSSAHNLINSATGGVSAGSCGASGAGNYSSGPATPSSYQLKISHDFHPQTYLMPTHCISCSALIKGIIRQGFQCNYCKKNFCSKCKVRAEATSEGCLALAPTQMSSGYVSNSSAMNQQAPMTPTIASYVTSEDSSVGGQTSSEGQSSNSGDKLEPINHVNMSKRKSASNLLHFNIANPFKSHHNSNQQSSHSTQHEKSTSKSMRGSAGALDPVLQQLSRQMKSQAELQQQQQLSSQQQQAQQHTPKTDKSSDKESSSNKLLNVQTTQLSSSHQNLFSMNDRDNGNGTASGCSSAHQSPSKGNVHQLSNSARTSARDLLHAASPTRRDQVSYHTFTTLDSVSQTGDQSCDVCNKLLNSSSKPQQQPAMCKTCKLQVHSHCQDLALADCLSRITESSRAAAERSKSGDSMEKSGLKNSNSNLSRDNIRLHRLAPSVKHVKKPDLTKPIIEGWLEHKTLSDEQPRKHYWRLDATDITLYENDTSARYFKAIALSKITRVISASSLPKRIKEDVALSSPKHDKQQTKSANTSPAKNDELKAQMNAMFAFEVATGSVYLVQANDEEEASRWKGSLELVTTKRTSEQCHIQKEADGATKAAPLSDSHPNLEKNVNEAQESTAFTVTEQEKLQPQQELIAVKDHRDQQQQRERLQQQQQHRQTLLTSQQVTEKQRHHHHHHHHAPSSYRGQLKTYTDPNHSRLYNRPRIQIKLDPMSIPDHWIEGKYLIERDRHKGIGFEELGSGQFGKVYAAISEIKAVDPTRGIWSGIPVAIKEISKARFDLRQQAKLKNEANILSRLDHPGVIILERVHDLPDKLYIVMEQLEDDMLEMIVSTEEKRLNERVTKFLTYQILEALKYLHSQNIAHCDLKPENVLLVERRSQFPQIKLCDFGFAKIIEDNSFRSSLVGTPAYLAPEVVKGERYNRSVDLWSVGVIVYVSLSGEFPFNEGENIHDQISRANFMYPDQPWAKISTKAKNFINSLLRVNSDKRLSANRAQMDDWIQDYQLWCDLCELEVRVGRRWVTDDADYERWTRFARLRNLQVPRSAIQLHQLLHGD